jgi:hypothetical protein
MWLQGLSQLLAKRHHPWLVRNFDETCCFSSWCVTIEVSLIRKIKKNLHPRIKSEVLFRIAAVGEGF